MKKNVLLLVIACVFALVSCGGASDEKKTEEVVKPVCEVENSFSVTIQDYHYAMSDTLVFDAPNFEVKASEYTWLDDSTLSVKLSNYTIEEVLGYQEPAQLDISFILSARQGKKLDAGYYGYNDYPSGQYCQVSLHTAYGEVWFNRLPEMPEEGGITIEYLSEDDICGTFALNVEKPDDEYIGIVKLNGTFVHKNAK